MRPSFFWKIVCLTALILPAACTSAPVATQQLPSPTAISTPITKTEVPKTEVPKTEVAKTEVAKTDGPKAEANPMIQPKRTLNIAHRGARSLAPENTLAAARKGLEIGADLWELDVAMTVDGVLVVLHDDTLERTSNVGQVFPNRQKTPVYEFTLAELRQLDFGSWYVETDPFKQIAAGAVSQAELEKFKGEPIPTLEEALKFTRDAHWKVNVEIKDASRSTADATIVQKTVTLIEELGMVNQVLISSFNHTYIQRVKSINPNIVTAALVEKADSDPAGLLKRLGAQAYNPSAKAISASAIKPLRDQGFDVYIYTVNDEAAMKTLVAAGASGIFTDFPQVLKKVLQ